MIKITKKVMTAINQIDYEDVVKGMAVVAAGIGIISTFSLHLSPKAKNERPMSLVINNIYHIKEDNNEKIKE